MTSVEIKFQNMKENAFSPPAEPPPGLVQALLELDEEGSGSDEEFLDFQFRIADANATLREREATEQMADWKAAFASLQLKQAHEVAEFALARRKEDELRIESQTKEIDELRRNLEAMRLETEEVKANCALVTEEKLKVEEEFVHQLRICESFRENVNELSKAQDRMFCENMELKRALDEAVITTARLKVALEEKAAELVAWLGHEGVAPNFSPKAQEKKAYTVQAVRTSRPVDGQNLETLFAGEEQAAHHPAENSAKDDVQLLSFDTEKLIIALEEEFDDMKHEVLNGTLKDVRSRADVQDSHLSLKDESGIELKRDGVRLDIVSSKEKKVLVNLRQRIKELQLELERLQSLESVLDEQQPNKDSEHWDVKKSLFVIEPSFTASSSDESCTDVNTGDDQLSEGKLESKTLDSNVVFSVANEVVQPIMTERQFSDSVVSGEHSEATSVSSVVNLEDKFICVSRNQPWSIETISKLVESITEELTKLLRVVVKRPNPSVQNTFTDLDTRVKSWSTVTTKTLQAKVCRNGAIEEWKDLVVDLLGQTRQELMAMQQRLCDWESELALMDKLQAEGLAASQTISLLNDEIQRLEAQSFNDHIEREDEVNLLKEELEQAKQLIAEAQRRAAEEQKIVISLRDQLHKSEIELENSKLGWAAEQDFINSCLGDGKEEPYTEEKEVSRKEMGGMEKKMEALMDRLEENERELGELLIISGVDPDSVLSAKLRRLEQSLQDSKASEAILVADKAELASNVAWLKAKLAEVEHELQLENQQHVEMLIRYEEEQGQLEDSSRSETGNVSAKLLQMEQLLAEKTKQLEIAQGIQDLSASHSQVMALRTGVLTLENSLAVTKQKAAGSEMAMKSRVNKEVEKFRNLEVKFIAMQSSLTTMKTQLGETEQKERRAQSKIEKLLVELGIAKEEVLKYEVRLQKTLRQAKEDVEAEKRKHEETINSQKQMEWHLCRQLELTEGLEREKAELREVLVEFEQQNLALQKETDNLRIAYMQLARQTEHRSG